MKTAFISLLLVVLSGACARKKSLGLTEYLRYLNSPESGLSQNKVFNGVNYKLKMQPPAYLALSRSEGSMKSQGDFQREMDLYKGELNFIFILEDSERANGVMHKVFDKQEYGAVLSYANTDLKNDFVLVSQKDTLACCLLHLEAANSLQPVFRLSLGFHDVDIDSGPFTLVFNDNIFNNGPLNFYYPKGTLDQLPELKL